MKRIPNLRWLLATLVLSIGLAPAAITLASPEEAARIAANQTGARVLSVTPSNDPARPGYFVKVLFSDGRVEIKHINPKQ